MSHPVEGLIKEHLKYVTWACGRFRFNTEDRDMLVSVVLEKAWKYRDSFDGSKSKFKSWLYTLARTSAIDDFRQSESRGGQKLSIDTDLLHHPSVTLNVEEDIEIEIAVFKKSTVDSLKYQEIAEEFNMPLGTVKNMIFRVRDYLRNKSNIKSPPRLAQPISRIGRKLIVPRNRLAIKLQKLRGKYMLCLKRFESIK
jgi:DNA-directed RNA polymerase specialized sigma24 family protein